MCATRPITPISLHKFSQKLVALLISFPVLLASSFNFCITWSPSSKVKFLANSLHLSVSSFLFILAALGCLVGFYAAYLFSSWIILFCFQEKGNCSKYKSSYSLLQLFKINHKEATAIFFILLLSSAGTITICSKSSFLYPFNDWVDSNCFMTVGKSVLYGKVPYRDLYEQKGPFLYALHTLASLVSRTSFIGVYFLEIIAAFLFLYYSWRSMQIFNEKRAIFWIPVLAVIVYSSSTFHYGDSAEELCLPFFSYGLWIGLKSITQKHLPTPLESLFIGITSGCVLWTKFNLLGFYVGWFLAIAILLYKNTSFHALLKMVGIIIIGVLLSTLPWIIYFGANGALNDLFEVYFHDNLFYYTVAEDSNKLVALLKNLRMGFLNIQQFFSAVFLLLIVGTIGLIQKRQRPIFLYFLLVFTLYFSVIYMGGRHYQYYALAFAPFTIFGLSILDDIIHPVLENKKPLLCMLRIKIQKLTVLNQVLPFTLLPLEISLCLTFAFLLSPNTSYMHLQQSELPQYQFKSIIEQTPNATLLNYDCLDVGLYTVCDIVPDCRYFCRLNSANPDIENGQDEYIRTRSADYVVVRFQDSAPKILEESGYTCIAKSEFYLEDILFKYYLYALQK